MPYSPVTHPEPVSLKKGGTLSSTEAEQITFVLPTSIRQDPSANFMTLRFMLTFLI
jgi:hypothetical protein